MESIVKTYLDFFRFFIHFTPEIEHFSILEEKNG